MLDIGAILQEKFEKAKIEVLKFEKELNSLNKIKNNNELATKSYSSFHRCKSVVLKYMSLKEPTKDQIERLVKRVEIDKEKKYMFI